MFKKYMHLEKLDSREVDGLLSEPCYIMPKLDGSNASIWWDGTKLCCGSRNNQLDENNTLNGFYNWVQDNSKRFIKLFNKFIKTEVPHAEYVIIYGEWLVPHNIKEYVDSAWRQFYIFDFWNMVTKDYCNPSILEVWAEELDLLYIPVIGTTDEITPKDALEQCTWLMQEGHKHEGVVIKRVNYRNFRDEAKWAKYVRSDFGTTDRKKNIRLTAMAGDMEQAIVDEYITEHLIQKEIAKICVEKGLEMKDIRILGQSLGKIWHAVITEELWDIMKKFKCPTINFAKLKALCDQKVKDKFGV